MKPTGIPLHRKLNRFVRSGLLEETCILGCTQINHKQELSSDRHCYASRLHWYIYKQHTMAVFLMTDVTYFPPAIRHWFVPTLRWCTVSAPSRVWIASPTQVSFTRTEAWRIYCGMDRHLSLNLHHPEFKSQRKLLSRSLTWEREFKQLCTANGHNGRSRWPRGLRRGILIIGIAEDMDICVLCLLCCQVEVCAATVSQ